MQRRKLQKEINFMEYSSMIFFKNQLYDKIFILLCMRLDN